MANHFAYYSSVQGPEETGPMDFNTAQPTTGGWAMDRTFRSNFSNISAGSMCTDDTYGSIQSPTTPHSFGSYRGVPVKYETSPLLSVPMEISWSGNSQYSHENDSRYVSTSPWTSPSSTKMEPIPWATTSPYPPQYPQTLEIQSSYLDPQLASWPPPREPQQVEYTAEENNITNYLQSSSATASHSKSKTSRRHKQPPEPRTRPQPLRSITSPTSDPVKPTPKSLDWDWEYLPDVLKFYTFVVDKGREPYFELLPKYTITKEYPEKIYLDQPRHIQKSHYPCAYPLPCTGKQTTFARPADLERHYMSVHCPPSSRDIFPCDFPKCARHKRPFGRKDHYRDHLRDFHKEDIGWGNGGASSLKGLGKGKERKDGGKEREREREKEKEKEKAWWGERRVWRDWWRCARCLCRVSVESEGWVCGGCKGECEGGRRRMRERMRPEEGGKTMSSGSQNVSVSSMNGYATQESGGDLSGSTCRECEGVRWVAGLNGEWKLCGSCGDVGNEELSWTTDTGMTTTNGLGGGGGVDQCAEMQMEFAYESWEGGGAGGY